MIRFAAHLLIVIIVGIVTYQLATIAFKIIPPSKKLKASSRQSLPDINKLCRPLFSFVGRFLYMEPYRESNQQESLMRAGIDLSPREYLGRSICGAAFGLLIAFWGYLMGSKFIIGTGILFAVALFGISNDDVNQRLKEKDAEIRKELPKFVSTIIVSLRSEKNIIKIIESYIKDARPALRSDLEVLLSQMSTGNIETALRNFDIRMGAQEISSLTTSLIYIENGVDQTAALQYLESDMRQAQATLRRLELDKLPGKMRASFVPIGLVLILMFFYTIGWSVIKNFTLFL